MLAKRSNEQVGIRSSRKSKNKCPFAANNRNPQPRQDFLPKSQGKWTFAADPLKLAVCKKTAVAAVRNGECDLHPMKDR